jgi:quercetin dioxygenase-like cupin family protein
LAVAVVDGSALQFRELVGRLSADPLPTGAAPCSMRVVRIGPGPRAPHLHPHSVEVMYVVAGTGTTWEDHVPSRVKAGDVVLVPQGVPHVSVADGPDELVLVCFFPHPDLAANVEELDGPLREHAPR